MRRIVLMLALTLGLGIGVESVGVQIFYGQQATGLRVGLGLGSATLAIRDPATGEVTGPALDLSRALAARIGVELQPVYYPRPDAVLEGVRTNAWDVAFLVIAPARAAEPDFSPPYFQSDFIEEAKASGLVKQVIERHGLRGIQVAPARNPSTQ